MTKRLFLASTCALALHAAPVSAQDAAAPAAAAAPAVQDEGDIIVTAQRRSESLSDVPIAISAIGSEQLQNAGISDVKQLNQLAPSLFINSGTTEATSAARIRGVGTFGENPGLEAAVGLFIDGVYRSRTGVGVSELGEIERIEVLRGPQGTLSGRNSSAGTINIITKSPSFDFGGQASATYGNYDYIRLDGGLTGPVVADKLAFRVDGAWIKRDGFIKQATPGEPDVQDRDRWVVRGQLLFEPSADLSIRLIGDYGSRSENCCVTVYPNPIRSLRRDGQGNVVAGPNPLLPILQTIGANFQLAPSDQWFVRRTATTPGVPYTADSEDWGFSGEVNWDIGDVKLTSISAYRDYFYRQGADTDYQAADLLRRTAGDRHFKTFTQELRLQGTAFDDRLDWLVGGYFADEKLDVSDDLKFGADMERWANCLAVLGAGGALGAPNVNSATCSTAPATTFPGFQGIAAALGARRLGGTGAIGNIFHQKSRNYAAFTHNVIQIVPDKLSLTLGLRYTHETKSITSAANMDNDLCSKIIASPFQSLATIPCFVNQTAPSFTRADRGTRMSGGELTGTAILTFRPTDDLMTYVSYARGYKSGGFNLDVNAIDRPCSTTAGTPAQNAACTALLARPAYTPLNGRPEASDLQFAAETVTAYEFGAKWDGPGIDISGALFYQQFSNFQFNVFNGVNFEVTNIQACRDDLNGGDTDLSATTGACDPNRLRPGMISKGVELEASMRPARHLQLNAGLTYTDTKFRKNLVGTGGNPLTPALFQLPGRRPAFSSAYAVTGSLSWTPPISSDLSALVYVDFRYMSDVNTGGDLDREKVQDGYGVVNARIGINRDDRLWGIELWASNLLNTRYQTTAADGVTLGSGTFRGVASGLQASASQIFHVFPGEPRTYGVTLRTRF
ncbi:MAG: TonB-dependent receptor [Sphingopyxis sp.]|nr:TonB-dependent receptor [Sphingopyxis sp.]